MKRRLVLDYRLPTGRLAPHFEALARGQALGWQCGTCRNTAFPPALTCAACGSAGGGWVPLSGRAAVQHRTETPDAAFALVRFDGADTATLVRLTNPDLKTTRGRLVPPETDAGLWLALEEPEDEDRTVR
ncbi:MAG: hypothetical protein HUJ24_03990 [Rhodobacteraceae bacterium]|nr:hypothetical protein [Paracoccaceae bacterium]